MDWLERFNGDMWMHIGNGPANFLKINPDIFKREGECWESKATLRGMCRDTLLIESQHGAPPCDVNLPENHNPIVLYSFQLELPTDRKLAGKELIVENIAVPKTGWSFSQISPEGRYAPHFNKKPNSGLDNPDAPADTFYFMVDAKCESDLVYEKTNKRGKDALMKYYDEGRIRADRFERNMSKRRKRLQYLPWSKNAEWKKNDRS